MPDRASEKLDSDACNIAACGIGSRSSLPGSRAGKSHQLDCIHRCRPLPAMPLRKPSLPAFRASLRRQICQRTTDARTGSWRRHRRGARDHGAPSRDDLETILLAETDAFEDGTHQVGALVLGREADPCRTRTRIQMRCSLAHQIRKPKSHARPRARAWLRRSDRRRRNRKRHGFGTIGGSGPRPASLPSHAKSRARHDKTCARGRQDHKPAFPDRRRRLPKSRWCMTRRRADDSVADGAGSLIAGAGNYRRAGVKACCRGSGCMCARDSARFMHTGGRIDRSNPSRLAIPSDHCRFATSNSAVPLASETSLAKFAAEFETQIIFRQKYGADGGELFRLVIAYPKQFRQGEAGKDRIRGVPEHGPEPELGIDEVYLRSGCAGRTR